MKTQMKKRRIGTRKTKRKQDLFTYLPLEIITEILSRIPAQTILSCKCVCKLWRDLVETNEFTKSHLSKSVCGLALSICPNTIRKTIEFTNVLDLQQNHLDDLHFSTITKLNFIYSARIEGSANGLLLVRIMKRSDTYDLYLHNPITNENINLHSPTQVISYPGKRIIYGFGVSRITGQYKAVRLKPHQSDYKVYTIGTGHWRRIALAVVFRHIHNNIGVFVNGNLHWFVYDLNNTPWISCFNLETELFSTFSPPLLQDARSDCVVLVVVEGNLCLCYPTSSSGKIIIWLMKEYGVEKSWTIEFVIRCSPNIGNALVHPIRISKHGVVFLASGSLHYYSDKNRTIMKLCKSDGHVYLNAISYTPSLVLLKDFEFEYSF